MMRSLALLGLLAVTVCAADVRVNLRLGVGHPFARPGRTVIVRPLRPGAVVVRGPIVYAAPIPWVRTVVALPPRERLHWQASEVIGKREDWVDTTLAVNDRGRELFLEIDGKAHLDFAEVHFGNGRVQVVDFKDSDVERGTFRLFDFGSPREVVAVRLVAKAQTPEARLTVFLAR